MADNEKRQFGASQLGREDELFFPNDIIIKEIFLYSGPLRKADVKRLLIGFNLFEDLYSNVLTGSVTLVDSINLIGKMPIIGQEQLQVTFKTPGFPGRPETSLVFDIYNISERNAGRAGEGTDATQTYTLHFVSQAYFRNQQSRVMKAYPNQPISDMVSDITTTILKEPVVFEQTAGSHSFIIPRWSPFRALNWLACRARPETNPHAANYFFYETVDGFQFRSVNSMVQEAPIVRFLYDMANVRKQDPNQDRKNQAGAERLLKPEIQLVRGYSVLPSGSTMEHIDEGMYASTLITHDIVKKGFSVKTFNYADHFHLPGMKHTESVVPGSEAPGETELPQDPVPLAGNARHGRRFDSVVKFYPKHTNLFDDMPNYDRSEAWLLERMSQLRQIEAQRVKINVPGLNFLRVGQMVILEVPAPEPPKSEDPPEDRDPKLTGKYLVTSIHHIISNDEHEMVVELSKESLLPDAEISMTEIADSASTSSPTGTLPWDDITTGIDIPTIGFI